MNIRHKGFKKDCPDGELTEAGFIKIYTQVKILNLEIIGSFVFLSEHVSSDFKVVSLRD